jgi:hypothetical protein
MGIAILNELLLSFDFKFQLYLLYFFEKKNFLKMKFSHSYFGMKDD